MKIFLATVLIFSGLLSNAQTKEKDKPLHPIVVRNISIFRNEIQLDTNKNKDVKVGTKFLAKTSAKHKCLLVVTRIARGYAYADATQCPGYATLRKGQSVLFSNSEINEEVSSVPIKEES